MLHSLSKRIAFLVCEKTDLLPLEIYVYGFELIISSIIETGALLLVGFLIGKFVETILFLVSFSSIRFFSGGYHANSYLKCFAVTLVNYFLVLFLYNNLIDFSVNIILVFSLVTFILSLILFIKVCPVKSKGKTILNYKMQKRLSVIALCINMALVMVLFYILKNSILIIVLPTILMVDTLIIIEKIKQGVVKDEKENEWGIKENVWVCSENCLQYGIFKFMRSTQRTRKT